MLIPKSAPLASGSIEGDRQLNKAIRYVARCPSVSNGDWRGMNRLCLRVCLNFKELALDDLATAMGRWNRQTRSGWPENELRRILLNAKRYSLTMRDDWGPTR